MPEERVRVIVPDTGSGYGGKHTGDAAIEAARLAKAAGKPVKLELDARGGVHLGVLPPRRRDRCAARRSRTDGTHHGLGVPQLQLRRPRGCNRRTRSPTRRSSFHPSKSPLRQGSYRGLAATANHFARESLHGRAGARRSKMDPLEFRLKNLKDERLRDVLEAAAEKFGWRPAKKAAGRGFGIAAGFEKGGYVATCAEVAVDRAAAR